MSNADTSPSPAAASSSLPAINMMYIGRALGLIERACLLSFLRAGHPVRLFTYRKLDGIPKGIDVQNARDVLPAEKVAFNRGMGYALLANYFRYKVLKLGLGFWVDTDVYCLKPYDFAQPAVYGRQDVDTICPAVLRLPQNSKLLASLLAVFEGPALPEWLPLRDRIGLLLEGDVYPFHLSFQERLRLVRKLNFSRKMMFHSIPWETLGPRAITHLADEHNVARDALPKSVFYPLTPHKSKWIADPARPLESWITPETYAIHLWNERIARFKERPAKPGTFLARLQEEGALPPEDMNKTADAQQPEDVDIEVSG